MRTLGFATAIRGDQLYWTLFRSTLKHWFVHLWNLFNGLDNVVGANFLQKSHFLKFRFRALVSLQIAHRNLSASVLQRPYTHPHRPYQLKIPHHNQPFKLFSFLFIKTLIRQFRLWLTFQFIIIFVFLNQRFLTRTHYRLNHSFGRFFWLLEYFVGIGLFLGTQIIDLRLYLQLLYRWFSNFLRLGLLVCIFPLLKFFMLDFGICLCLLQRNFCICLWIYWKFLIRHLYLDLC